MTPQEYFDFLDDFMSLFSGVANERRKMVIEPGSIRL